MSLFSNTAGITSHFYLESAKMPLHLAQVKSMPNQTPNQTDSTFIYDIEKLLSITSDEVVKAGLLYSKQDRVIDYFHQQQQLFARVEASDNDVLYDVELFHDEDGQLQVTCDCRNSTELVCKHAVATLITYNQANGQIDKEAQQFSSAKDTAIKDRIKRGQTEVKAKHLSGHPWFGTWQAASLISSTHRPQNYTVHIRSLSEKINYCTCPDLANNQLGTCKHIEAVLHQISKRMLPDMTLLKPQPPFVYQSFTQHKQIKIQRTGAIDEPLAEIIDQYFDPQGIFTGELPDDFFNFSNAIYGNDNIVVGEDAKQAVQKLVSAQSHQLKAHKIHQQIMLSDGQLPGLNAKLYPYQIEGTAFLAANGRGLLADDMGLGKTLQAIAGAIRLIQQEDIKRIVIICPASLKHQWAREIEKFSGFSSQIIQGGPQKRQAQYHQDKTFFIINYELVMRDLTLINTLLKPDLMILDEAQRIKNWRTKVASSIKLIQSTYAFVLTGTPLENRLEDLYSLMQVVNQDVLGPLWRYLSDYHITDDKGKVLGYRNLTELRERISPFMLRRNRSIVSDQLPGRTTLRLDVPMTTQQLDLHDSALAAAAKLASIAKTRPLTPSESNRMMAALQQARMACDAAGLVDKQTKGSPKLKELKTLITEQCIDNGVKMVVFSQWRGMTTLVEEMLRAMNVGFVHLHGGVPTAKRGGLMDQFKDNDAISVFISTDAGGSGLNLQSASILVNLDIPWNPAVLEQRNARIHRLGQSNKVQIILMIAEDSYEQRVYQLVNNKQALFDNVVDPQGSEDVVGVSKKALDSVLDDLNKDNEEPTVHDSEDKLPSITVQGKQPPVEKADAEIVLPEMLQSDEDQQIKAVLLQIQQHFGSRIEQIMAKGGGLLIIADSVEADDNGFIATLELSIPIAIVDVKTIQQLQGLGIDAITTDAQAITLPEVVAAPTISLWLRQAKERLNAAETLLAQMKGEENGEKKGKQNSAVIELICAAIAAFLTEKAQLPQLMTHENIPLWLYATAVPQQLLTMEQATIISRVSGLRLAEAIPDGLLRQCFDEAQGLVAGDNNAL